MDTTHHALRRASRSIAVAAAIGALTAPAAFARTDPYGPLDPWLGHALSLTAPSTTSATSPFITDTLAPGGGSAVGVTPAETSFSWMDAGAGAATAGAICALIGGGLLVARRRPGLTV